MVMITLCQITLTGVLSLYNIATLCLLNVSYAIGHLYLEYTSEYLNVHTHH